MDLIRNPREWGEIILIGGPCRVGKSIVASQLKRRTGFKLVKTDRLRKLYNSIQDLDARLVVKARTFFELVEQQSSGLIIEGEELITKNRGNTRTRPRSE